MDDYDFPVDDCLTGNIQGAGNQGKSFGPIQPVAGVDLLLSSVHMNLDPVAVVFDFVNPLLSLGSLGLQGGKLGFNEPRHLCQFTHERNSQKNPAARLGGTGNGASLPLGEAPSP
jgi:hypothetical protein